MQSIKPPGEWVLDKVELIAKAGHTFSYSMGFRAFSDFTHMHMYDDNVSFSLTNFALLKEFYLLL